MDNLEEKDKSFKKFSLPRLNQEEIEIMYRPITITEIETVIKKKKKKKNLPKRKAQGQTASQVNSMKCLEKSQCLSFSKSSKKLQEKKTLPNSFYEATLPLIPKPDKDTTKKEIKG